MSIEKALQNAAPDLVGFSDRPDGFPFDQLYGDGGFDDYVPGGAAQREQTVNREFPEPDAVSYTHLIGLRNR